MNLSQILKNDKFVWRVYVGTFKGKKKYKQFKTKEAASKFVRDEKIRKASLGRVAEEASPSNIVEWAQLHQLVSAVGGNLREAVEMYLTSKELQSNSQIISVAVEQYLTESKKRLSPYTWSDRRRRLNTFAESAPDLLVCDITPKKFLDDLAERTSHVNADNTRRSLSAFYTWAIHQNMLTENPIAKIPSYKSSKKQGAAIVLSIPQTKFLLKKVDSEFDVEVAGYILLSIFAGIRPMEFRKRITDNGKPRSVWLAWEDILDGNIRVSGELSKTGHPRLVPINDTLKNWLKWMKEKHGSKMKGPIVSTRFKFLWADWRKAHADDLPWKAVDIMRHSYGTYRVSQAQEVGKVALEMGNSEAIVKKHYYNAMRSSKDAEKYWAVTPKKLLTK